MNCRRAAGGRRRGSREEQRAIWLQRQKHAFYVVVIQRRSVSPNGACQRAMFADIGVQRVPWLAMHGAFGIAMFGIAIGLAAIRGAH